MKEFFARLNPTERRFVVGVCVLFFIVINFVWVFPHFSDWGTTKDRMDKASKNLALFESGTNLVPDLEKEITKYQKQGEVVPLEDQALRFVRLIQNEAARSGVVIEGMNPQRQVGLTNNPFFVESDETMTLQSGEKQLVDFLYNLGAGNSLIRVKVLTVQPDPAHQRLTTRATLVASYQRKAVAAAPAPARGATKAAPTPAAPANKPPAATPPAKPASAPGKPGPTNRMNPAFPLGPKPLTPIKK